MMPQGGHAALSDSGDSLSVPRAVDVLGNLAYFTEWGGRPWQTLCRHALERLGDLDGKTVLEVGPRFGRMSACFALLGARVVGVDTDADALEQARGEVRKWGVESKVTFAHYDGDLDRCSATDGSSHFDIVFTKSVLVKMGDSLPAFLRQLDTRLAAGGRCIFIENRRGGRAFSWARRVWPSSRGHYASVSYFDQSHLDVVNDIFPVVEIAQTSLPPVYLIVAQKKPTVGEPAP